MQISPEDTLLDYFYYWEKQKPEETFLKQPVGDTYRDFTWVEAGDQVRRLAAFLKNTGLPPQSNIGLFSKNCAEWILTDLAIMMAGHVSVPFYPTLTGEQLNQVLTHSGCKYLFVGKLDSLEAVKTGVPAGVTCISFPGYNPEPTHLQYKDLLQSEPLQGDFRPGLDELVSIIYTSGTTGNPKGVMTRYRAFAEAIYKTRKSTLIEEEGNRFFSYLPLSHIAERNIVEAAALASGGTIYFAESLETFAENLKRASPTHFLAVPRIWTKFQLGILSKMPQKKLNLFLRIPLLRSIVKAKIKKGLGLTDAKIMLTGAAPMPVSLLRWYRKIGIEIQEAYGMTENLGAVCLMPAGIYRDGSVGRLHPGMQVKIDGETGEILTKAVWNMAGYYREPEMTAECIDKEGWLHTGDVGLLEEENFLQITGRVKEMYKTSKGEYVVPSQIEFAFSENELIEQICVVGQSLPQPIALVNLSEIAMGLKLEQIKEQLRSALERINGRLKSYEKVRKMVVMKEGWTEANNCLTPTLKIKRGVIEKRFAGNFENWYEAQEEILWEA